MEPVRDDGKFDDSGGDCRRFRSEERLAGLGRFVRREEDTQLVRGAVELVRDLGELSCAPRSESTIFPNLSPASKLHEREQGVDRTSSIW